MPARGEKRLLAGQHADLDMAAVQAPVISQRSCRGRQSRAIQLSQAQYTLRGSGGGYLAPGMGIWSLFASVGAGDCEHPRCARFDRLRLMWLEPHLERSD